MKKHLIEITINPKTPDENRIRAVQVNETHVELSINDNSIMLDRDGFKHFLAAMNVAFTDVPLTVIEG